MVRDDSLPYQDVVWHETIRQSDYVMCMCLRACNLDRILRDRDFDIAVRESQHFNLEISNLKSTYHAEIKR